MDKTNIYIYIDSQLKGVGLVENRNTKWIFGGFGVGGLGGNNVRTCCVHVMHNIGFTETISTSFMTSLPGFQIQPMVPNRIDKMDDQLLLAGWHHMTIHHALLILLCVSAVDIPDFFISRVILL